MVILIENNSLVLFSMNSRIDWSERIDLRWFRTLQTISIFCSPLIGTGVILYCTLRHNHMIWLCLHCWEISLAKVRTLGLVFKHCKFATPFLCMFTISYLAIFIISDYKNQYLLSILHFYHHLFAELVHLYNLPLYWVCWGHKRLLVFGCRVVWERPSSSYTSHGLINLRSSTWRKIATVLPNSALGGPTHVYKNKFV